MEASPLIWTDFLCDRDLRLETGKYATKNGMLVLYRFSAVLIFSG